MTKTTKTAGKYVTPWRVSRMARTYEVEFVVERMNLNSYDYLTPNGIAQYAFYFKTEAAARAAIRAAA